MADELDERLSDEQSKRAFRSYQVAHGEDREKQPYDEARHHLHGPVSSPPAWELIVPARGQQLLTVGLGHKLQGKQRDRESQCYGPWLPLANENTELSLHRKFCFK